MSENLQTKKEQALQAYKLAKTEFMTTVTKDNIKGDFKKMGCVLRLQKNLYDVRLQNFKKEILALEDLFFYMLWSLYFVIML